MATNRNPEPFVQDAEQGRQPRPANAAANGGVAVTADWDVGPGTLTSVSAWRYWLWDPQNDRDFLGLPITSKSNNPSHQDQYSQELRLSGETGKVSYTLGAFGFYQKIQTDGIQEQGPAASRWLMAPMNGLSIGAPAPCASKSTPTG